MKGRAQDVNTKIPFTIRRKGPQMRLDKASFVLNLEGKALKITSTPFLCSRKIPKKERRPDED